MADQKSKRDQMMEIVILSFSTPVDFLERKYNTSERTIRRWRRKFEEEGLVDPELMEIKAKAIAPSESVTPEITHTGNIDIFTDEALKVRLQLLRKMSEMIKKEKDLDKLTKALKAVDDVIDGVIGDNSSIRSRNSIFDAAEIIEANMEEIIQKQLK